MIRSRGLVLATGALTAAVVTVAVAGQAGASSPPITTGASAHSAAAYASTSALTSTLKYTGSLKKLVDPLIAPIVSQDIQPLLNALNSTVASLSGLLGVSADTNAGDTQVATAPPAWPDNTVPSPCPTGAHCYSAASTTGAVGSIYGAGLASTTLGALTGYVEEVQSSADATNPILARASGANLDLGALQLAGLPASLLTATTIQSAVSCPNTGATPSANDQAAGVSLLGGAITFNSSNGWPTNLVVGGVSYPDTVDNKGNTVPGLLSLGSTVVNGDTISRFGQGLIVSIPLSVDQVLKSLGLPAAVVSVLETLAPTSTVKLSLSVVSHSAVTSSSANAWGLGVGLDLSGALSFDLLNVVTAAVTIASGITGGSNGNLLDLRLAYSTCTAGSAAPPNTAAIPPALV